MKVLGEFFSHYLVSQKLTTVLWGGWVHFLKKIVKNIFSFWIIQNMLGGPLPKTLSHYLTFGQPRTTLKGRMKSGENKIVTY